MKKALTIIGFLGCFAIILFALRERSVHGQTVAVMSSTPSTILAGSGSPVTNGIYCGSGAASSTSTSLYDDTSVATGNSLWKCKVQTDGVTYAWAAPFGTPITATTATIGGSLMLLNSTITTTVTVANVTTGEVCDLNPSNGVPLPAGVIKDCYVTGTGTNNVTVRLTALIAATPSSTSFNLRFIP